MPHETEIQSQLTEKFAFLQDQIRIPRPRRMFANVPAEHFATVFEYALKTLHFTQCCTITGLDEGEVLSAIYFLAKDDGTMLNLKLSVPKTKPTIHTISEWFPASAIYERELEDLLGFEVEGLPSGNRYPLPENFPQGQHPLRKDWKGV